MKWIKKLQSRPPAIVRAFFYPAKWKIKTSERKVFLSFDDGPHPQITPWVLDLLDKYQAKATFFCVGENIKRYPETFQQIIDRGHHVGNHTYNHLVGWKAPNDLYSANIQKCQELTQSPLFRPPHGRIKLKQLRQLHQEGFQIILWSALSFDFDRYCSPNDCLSLCKKHSFPGSILVFHDSEKAWPNLKEALPAYLAYMQEIGFVSAKIPF